MSLSRRRFVELLPAFAAMPQRSAIDRRALVRRHNPVLTSFNPRSPLSVGNGELAFTADATGLQTFPEAYENTVPLCTQSQWGWHSFPALQGLGPENFRLTYFDAHGRRVGYPVSSEGQQELYNWLRENPHRLHLGRIGVVLVDAGGAPARPGDLHGIRQELDLWTGTLRSRFVFDGEPVETEVCCHPSRDAIAVRIRSALLRQSRLSVEFAFPYGSPAMNAADWRQPARHRSELRPAGVSAAVIARELDTGKYFATISWSGEAGLERSDAHRFLLRGRGPELPFTCEFTRATPAAAAPSDVFRASASGWQRFWSAGGALELSATTSAARELERRAVLSQYLTAIQCAGSMPPQETGLTCNSWYGKFHLEMHWWHAAHFALWGRTHLLERSLAWYQRILPMARNTAQRQGYRGARWPKMTAPDGRESPSPIGPLLIWQQPHIISFAELCWQANPTRRTLERYAALVFDSAEFMASYPALSGGRYVLGPPVIPAQENHPPRESWNPTFELEYWADALGVAQQWRTRLGMELEPAWERVRMGLAALPVRDGVYLAHENCAQTYTDRNRDHPSMLAALGVLPGNKVDTATMRRTLAKVFDTWRWTETWGWDYPMAAMTAARLGDPEAAVRALMMESPKNEWLPNGHVYQRPNLPLYLPANGGLLAALALMGAGWRGRTPGAPSTFPAGWQVRPEGLRPWL